MNNVKTLLITATLFLSHSTFASDNKHEAGEKLYQTNCAVCHGSTGGMDLSKRIAPPIAAVRMHYLENYSDESSFVEAVSNWVEKQDESKSLMRGAINRFKIMPPIAVSKEDAKSIAAYIFSGNIEKPEGFEEHVKEEHAKEGKGHGKGESMNHGKGMGKGMQGHDMGMHKMHGEGKGGMKAKMMQQLNLTPQQQQQLQALKQEKKSRIQPVKKELHQISQTIRQLDTTSPDYKSQIFSLAEEKAKRVQRMVIEKGELRMKMESILTAEQRSKLSQLRQQFRQKMQNH